MNKILNKISPLVILIFLLTFIFGLTSCKKEEDSYRNIKIVELEGDATITRKEKEYDAYVNMSLRSNDNILVKEASSLILKLDSDKYLYVGEKSNIDLVSSNKDSSKTLIKVNEGSIVSEVKNKLNEGEEYGVETPNSVMAIRGTTFGVTVSHFDDFCEITYKLIKGKIELAVIDQDGSNYNAGVFEMNPMELINITVENDAIIEGDALSNVAAAYANGQIEITNYDDVYDYISSSTKVSLDKSALEVEDIQDELKTLPTNHDDNINRVVALYSTFNIRDIGVINEVVYEQEGTYTIRAYALDVPDMVVSGWMVNGTKIDGGQITDIEITKSCTIEPIYVNYDSYYTVTFTKENIYSGVTDASYDPEVTINNETLTSGDDFYSDSFNIVFDDTVDSATGLAPILIGIYEVGPNSNEFLSCDLDYDYTPYNGDADVSIKYILLEENNLPQILVYTGAETTYFVTAVVDNLETLKQFTFKIGYTDFEIDPNAVDYVIRDENGAEVDNPTEPGNYYLEYFLKNKTGVSSYELQLEIIAEP